MTKKIYRRSLLAAAMLLAAVCLAVTPAQRRAQASETCQYCSSEYQYCLESCPPHDDLCRSRCDFDYSACVLTCEPGARQ